jgi:hypothetical protein
VNGWEVQPTLDRALARSSARIDRNRLNAAPGPDPASPAAHLRDELRLSKLVILLRPTPLPVAGDLAVDQPTTMFINRLIRRQ